MSKQTTKTDSETEVNIKVWCRLCGRKLNGTFSIYNKEFKVEECPDCKEKISN